jgi:anti-sigma factor RsiW
MNQKEFEKLKFSYADGELDPQQAAEVEAYLKTSPEARALVEADRQLKASLARSFAKEAVPPGLAHRAFAQLEDKASSRRPWARRIVPLGIVTAAAACVVIWVAVPEARQPKASGAEVHLAGMIEELHLGCSAAGRNHHCEDLPAGDLDTIRRVMSEKLQLAVLAPDLSSKGCAFESANYCSFPDHRGAHLIYVKDSSRIPLSVMTVDSMGGEMPCRCKKPYHGHAYFALHGERTNVVAWDHNGATYVICAELDEADLLEMAEPVRLALCGQDSGPSSSYAVSTIRLAMGANHWP